MIDVSSNAWGLAMQFRTRKDGVVYPLGGSGGGKKGAGVAVAGAVLAGYAAFGGASGGAVVGEGLGAAARVRVAEAQTSAARGQRAKAWKRVGTRQVRNKYKRQRHFDCVRNSHGEVRKFFVLTPCRSLDRALFVLADGRDNWLVVSVYWVRMRSKSAAAGLRELDDTYGTGNVNPLAGSLLSLGGVEFTGRYYDSRQSGSLVVISETEPVRGSPGAEVLESVAQVASQLPRP